MTWQQFIEAWYRYYHRATNIAFELPTVKSKKGMPMPNFELPNDEVVTITIKTTNVVGVVEPIPSGDVFVVTSSKPTSLGTRVSTDSAGNPAIVLTPMVQVSPDITVTVTDSAGLTAATLVVDIVQDVTPTNIILDVADAAHVSQPVPANPGP